MNKLSNFGVLAGMVAVVFALSATEVLAIGPYGAIAFNRGTMHFGDSWNQDTPAQAEALALGACNEDGCRIVVQVAYSCGAIAADSSGFGIGNARSRREADAEAIAQCGSGGCRILASDCSPMN